MSRNGAARVPRPGPCAVVIACVIACASGAASAEERKGSGLVIGVGAGLSGFTDRALRDGMSAQAGGLWSLRATAGSRLRVALEIAYVFTAIGLEVPVPHAASGTLIGSCLESVLRINLRSQGPLAPYVFGGVGRQHYRLDRPNARIGHDAELAVFPVGIGLAYRDPSGVILELRATFRAAGAADFVVDGFGHGSLHAWDASASLGYEL